MKSIADLLDTPWLSGLLVASFFAAVCWGAVVTAKHEGASLPITKTEWESVGKGHDHMWRYQVPGGWLYMQYNNYESTVFVPKTVTSTTK
jgi:hypothetical protein